MIYQIISNILVRQTPIDIDVPALAVAENFLEVPRLLEEVLRMLIAHSLCLLSRLNQPTNCLGP
jgi:hypothetical protein